MGQGRDIKSQRRTARSDKQSPEKLAYNDIVVTWDGPRINLDVSTRQQRPMCISVSTTATAPAAH